MSVLKVTTVGNSVGGDFAKGDPGTTAGGKRRQPLRSRNEERIQLTAYDPAFAEQVEAAQRVMREDRDALKKLAE